VPARGWRDVLWRTWRQLSEDNLSIVAAGVAFFAFLAVVPAMGAMIAIYALVADPAEIPSHLDTLQRVVPAEAMPLLRDQLTRMAGNQPAAGWSAVLALILTLVSSLKGTKALMQGLNIAYDERERRGMVKLHLTALVLTLGAIIGIAAMVALVAVIPVLLKFLHLPEDTAETLGWLRWPVIAAAFLCALAIVYRFGPSRDAPRWRWVSSGALAGVLIWLGGSAVFSFYVQSFGNFDATYGSLGAVVVFLLWLQLSAFVVLLGAELNSESERQTAQDTTQGQPEPMGHRKAFAADTVGPAKPE
jgi:membrane protein